MFKILYIIVYISYDIHTSMYLRIYILRVHCSMGLHLDKNKILNKNQFGFRANHSTTQAMLCTVKNLQDRKSEKKKTQFSLT